MIRLCISNDGRCTGLNPCAGCLDKIKNVVLPRAMAAVPFTEIEQAQNFLRGFLGSWNEMVAGMFESLPPEVQEQLHNELSASETFPQEIQTPHEFAPPQVAPQVDTAIGAARKRKAARGVPEEEFITDPGMILKQAEEGNGKAHGDGSKGGQVLNGSKSRPKRPIAVIRRNKKPSPDSPTTEKENKS